MDRPTLEVADVFRRYGDTFTAVLPRAEVANRLHDHPRAAAVAALGSRVQEAQIGAALEPLYVRPSDAKLPTLPS